jgi:hypothetical protein
VAAKRSITRVQDADDVDLSGASDGDAAVYDASTGGLKKGANVGSLTAAEITYDNSVSGETATDVQAAIDEHVTNTLLHPQELGFAEITTSQTIASSTPADIAGLSLPGIVVVDRPLEFVFTAPQGISSTVNNDGVVIQLLRDSTVVRGCGIDTGTPTSRAVGINVAVFRDHPAPGTYTYKLQWFRATGSGTCSLNATGTPYFIYPSFSCRELAAAL